MKLEDLVAGLTDEQILAIYVRFPEDLDDREAALYFLLDLGECLELEAQDRGIDLTKEAIAPCEP